MTRKENFYRLYIMYSDWDSASLGECVRWIKELYEAWSSMRKNAREATKSTMEKAVDNCINRIVHRIECLNRMHVDTVKIFDVIRDSIPEMDILFTKLNKEFPNQKVLYRLSTAGYIKP